MGRSVKKGPFTDQHLEKRIDALNASSDKERSLAYVVTPLDHPLPEFVGHTIAVHNGRKFIPVYVTENMVGHKMGEFSPTRTFKGHAAKAATEKSAKS